jgi:anti-sigma factor RsiW
MTSCDKCQANIVALLDNEGGDEVLRSAAGHFQDCPACRAFCLDLIAIRRAQAASMPSLSPVTEQKVLDRVRADQVAPAGLHAKDRPALFRFRRLDRWAAVLVVGVLVILCVASNRETRNLRDRLRAAERQVVSIREQDQVKEAQEKQQKAISALYFRMAELEERVNRGSPSRRASFPTQAYDHVEQQSNL